jgi:hypothetical protein
MEYWHGCHQASPYCPAESRPDRPAYRRLRHLPSADHPGRPALTQTTTGRWAVGGWLRHMLANANSNQCLLCHPGNASATTLRVRFSGRTRHVGFAAGWGQTGPNRPEFLPEFRPDTGRLCRDSGSAEAFARVPPGGVVSLSVIEQATVTGNYLHLNQRSDPPYPPLPRGGARVQIPLSRGGEKGSGPGSKGAPSGAGDRSGTSSRTLVDAPDRPNSALDARDSETIC